MSFLERSRIPVWIVPEELVANAVRDRGLQLEDLVDQDDQAPGVLLRAEIGEQVIADAVAEWRAYAPPGPRFRSRSSSWSRPVGAGRRWR